MGKEIYIRSILLCTVFIFCFNAYSQNDSTSLVVSRLSTAPVGDDDALRHFSENQEKGFRASDLPNFVIYNNKNFAFGIGGYVNLRVGYDVNGVVNNNDFYTSLIPVADRLSKHKFFMDGTTSRLFFKTVANAPVLGLVTAYIETDFRGASNNLRMRKGYIEFKGFMFGKNFTSLKDTEAVPPTVDFQGPNSLIHKYSFMVRYEYNHDDKWKIGLAVENPDISAVYADNYSAGDQKMPDIPMWITRYWNNGKGHIRFASVIRNFYYRDLVADKTRSELGWGLNLSMASPLNRKFKVYGETVYGKGMAQYIQDLNGNGFDLVADGRNPGRMQTLRTFGWYGALQYNFTDKWFCSGTYGYVRVYGREGFNSPDTYRLADYVAVNSCYNILPACQIGL
ncbi:MAG: DcaP family trimeric outer membrane transporter [Rikenellaceae bacterium]|nr:DcaP family trimeric outer membrane transporter [Rikenellaceae bacterium]